MIATETPQVVFNAQGNGASAPPGNFTRKLFERGVLMDILGYSPGELDHLPLAEFESTVRAKAEELKAKSTERTEIQDIMMEPLELHLAGKIYMVHPHKIADEKKWLIALGQIGGTVSGAVGPIFQNTQSGLGLDLESINIGQALQSCIPVIIGYGIPQLFDLMYLYSPELMADRSFIELNSTLDERIDAALEVLQIAFPRLLAYLQKMLKVATVAAAAKAS